MNIAEVVAEMDALLGMRRRLLESLERARNAGASTSGAMDGLPHAKPQEYRVEKYGTLAASIVDEIKSVDNMLKGDWERVRKPILSIPNVVQKKALTLRYMEFMPVAKIAAEVGYSRRHMYRVLDEAIEKMTHNNT
ncbi:MAG: hypothetical protein GXY67_10385 [Clostridiales bacterium]|nr:hypothetical protein [Clostridiales bacterium]